MSPRALPWPALLAAGCHLGDAPPAAKASAELGGARLPAAAEDDFSHVPVPPEDGPRLAPLGMKVPIYPRPDRSREVIGYLRVGARVARSPEPIGRRDCAEGWYAVRPFGFVCASDGATAQLDHPIARAIQVEPERSRAMPYRYAFVRAVAPNYLRIPSKDEQFQFEMHLERHLRNYARLKDTWDRLTVGANDVPLDANGFAVGKIPDHAIPMDLSTRFGGNGDDSVPWWLVGGRKIPNLSSFQAPPYAVIAGRVKRHAGVALIGTFVAGPEAQSRRFAISTDARLLPADKLKAGSGSPFHGYPIREVGLPIAFTRIPDVAYWDARTGTPLRGEKLGHREMVPLTGSVREVGGVRLVEARGGKWLRSEDLRVAAKPVKLPSWARGKRRWIDVGIMSQTLVLWEGDRPVYATLVSTGKDGLGDPQKTHSTPRGTFHVYQKHITTTMDSSVADQEFELRDVPWVMYFKGGYAIHGAYWHDDFGRARSHGCINLAPIDARWVFEWASPQVPRHWHAAYATDDTEPGTLVHIHP